MGEQLSTFLNRKAAVALVAAGCLTACGGTAHEVSSTTAPTTASAEAPSPSEAATTSGNSGKEAATTFLEQLKSGRAVYAPTEDVLSGELRVLTTRAGNRIAGELAAGKACIETTSLGEEKKNFANTRKELDLIFSGDDPSKGVADRNRAIIAVKDCVTYRGEDLMQDGQSKLGAQIKRELTSLYRSYSTENSGVLDPAELTKYNSLWHSAKFVKPQSTSSARTTIENSMLNYKERAESEQDTLEQMAAAAEEKVTEYAK